MIDFSSLQEIFWSTDPSTLRVAVVSVADDDAARFGFKRFVGGSPGAGLVRLGVGRLLDDPNMPRDVTVPGAGTVELLECTHDASCWVDAARNYRAMVDAEGFVTRPPIAEASSPRWRSCSTAMV